MEQENLHFAWEDVVSSQLDEQEVTFKMVDGKDCTLKVDIYKINLKNGKTLDLNGHVVTAKNALSFGVVMDTASEVGGIKISNKTTEAFTKLQPENGGYLPIYDIREGEEVGIYKFFEYKLVNAAGTKVSGKSVKFGIQLTFTNNDAYDVMANSADSGVSLSADVTWSNMSVPSLNFKLDDNLVLEYVQKKAAAPQKNFAITLTIGGLDNLQPGDYIRVTPMLTTITEVGCKIDTNEHIIG